MELKVIQSKTWRWYLSVSIALIMALILSAGSAWYLSGEARNKLGLKVKQLTVENTKLSNTIRNRELQITELGRSEQMANASVEQTGLNLSQLQEINKQLEKELSFYRSIMAPELDKVGLNIQSFELAKFDSDIIEFSLTLTQVKKQDWYLKGNYKIELISEVEGKEVKTLLNPMVLDNPFKPKFSFRYFQTLSHRFRLPEELKPQALLVSVSTQSGRQRVSKRFPWTL